MEYIFKDKNKEKGASITDLVLLILQLLREDIQEAIDSIKLVKLQDEGQLSHIIKLSTYIKSERKNKGMLYIYKLSVLIYRCTQLLL